MKKKIVGIFVCTLLIAAAVLPAAGVMNDTDTKVGMLPSNNFLIQSNGNEGCSLLNWSERQKLVASDGESYDYFGWSVSIDGDYAIVGEWGDDKDNGDYRDLSGSAKGSAYVFKRSGSSWVQEDKLTASDGESNDYFGYSVSIDGNYAIVGAWGDDIGKGSAYVFKRSGSSWVQEDKLTASDGESFDHFGGSVSIDGDYALVGAYGDDDNGEHTGSAYIFVNSGGNQPPNEPTITGETNGKKGTEYEYTFTTIDPNGDAVFYYIEWGDGTSDGWLGPHGSGEGINVSHKWSKTGTYTIRARAKDTNGLKSDWGTLTVTMPRNRLLTNTLFMRLIERFPNAFPILRQILGL